MAAAGTATAHAEPKSMSTEQTGLEKAAPKTPAVITTPEEYRGALLRWQEHQFNILTPFTNISGLAAQHGIITSLIQINPDKAGGEVYDGLPFLKGGEVSLAKVGLRKLAECAGISTRTERTDDRRIPFYWEFKAIASYRGIDGAIVTREATKEWDLRDGSAQMKGWTPNQVEEGRKHGLRNCEARAINAAIRECGCGVKQKYTRAELAKPFVVCRVMFQPDMSDPEIKKLVTQAALGGTTALYPHSSRDASRDVGPGIDVVEQDAPPAARHVGRGTTAPASTSSTEAPATKTPALPEGFGLIQKIEMQDIQKRAGGTFKKWTVIDYAGVVHVTTKAELADALQRCLDGKVPVDIESNENDYQENIIAQFVRFDAQQPSLLPDPANL
jgi:hypothetical protein